MFDMWWFIAGAMTGIIIGILVGIMLITKHLEKYHIYVKFIDGIKVDIREED
jgi:hypothetical protein